LEALHARSYIHHDIKPENFMVGFDDKIYLIDFGLAQSFRDPTTHIHILPITGHSLVGTIHYTSINSHIGLQQSRRDDLESFAYTLVFLLNGKLPWQGIRLSHRTDHRVVVRLRKEELCKQNCNISPSTLTAFFITPAPLSLNKSQITSISMSYYKNYPHDKD
jgi:serine/threonine protein kinase